LSGENLHQLEWCFLSHSLVKNSKSRLLLFDDYYQYLSDGALTKNLDDVAELFWALGGTKTSDPAEVEKNGDEKNGKNPAGHIDTLMERKSGLMGCSGHADLDLLLG
jgi:hypothetical protein